MTDDALSVCVRDLHRHDPRQLWRALTDPAFTSRHWAVTFETDWEAGSATAFTRDWAGCVGIDAAVSPRSTGAPLAHRLRPRTDG